MYIYVKTRLDTLIQTQKKYIYICHLQKYIFIYTYQIHTYVLVSPPSHSLRFWVVNPAGRLDNWCIKVTCIDESWLVSSDPLGTASNETSVPRLDPAAEPRGRLVPGRGRVPGRGSLGTPTYYTHLAHIQP